MASKTEQRAKEILRLLLSRGKMSAEELTAMFSTSAASVRRDLIRLEKQGLIHRTHGGAMLAGNTYEPFRFDAQFQVREQRFLREKHQIAVAAAAMIAEGDTVGFTAGTTTTQVARLVKSRSRLRVLTNAVNIGLELSANAKLDVTLTGGCIRWPGSFSLVGPAAMDSVQQVVLDKLFLGTCGVGLKYGVTTIQSEEAALFRAMCRSAKQTIVVADSSKLGIASPAVVCPLNEIDLLITDSGVSDQVVHDFTRHGARIQIA